MSCSYSQDQLVPSGYITPPDDWGQCLINMVRAHIGDYTDPPMYTDTRIFQIITAAAYLVSSDVRSCPIDKPTVQCNGAMSENPLNYPGFTNLVVLQSACMLDRGMARGRFNADGVRASCGPAMLQVTSNSATYDALFKYGACAAYDKLKDELCFLDPLKSAECAKQVVGLFISDYYEGKRWCRPCDRRS